MLFDRRVTLLIGLAGLAALVPPPAAAQFADPWRPRTTPLWGVSYGPDIGFVLGAGLLHARYAFRALPPSTRLLARAAYATGPRSGEAEVTAELRRPLAPATLHLEVRVSGLDIIRFYGLGNETGAAGPDSVYPVRQTAVLVAPTVSLPLAPRLRLALGPLVKHASTRADPATVFATTGPHYGQGDFDVVGAAASLELDTRDAPVAAARGLRLRIAATAYPAAWDATAAFGTVSAEAATFLSLGDPAGATLAVRVTGAATLGRVPFQELVYVGGATSVRGYAEQRFAGRRGAYANVELRGRVITIGAGDIGVFGLADAGRVWMPNESSDRWHGAAGGGLSFAPGGRRAETLSLAVARSPERTSVYLRAGLLF
ncbi:MAG: BamA/TamA family outer membrane protein [Gemmatimonadales bacterium]